MLLAKRPNVLTDSVRCIGVLESAQSINRIFVLISIKRDLELVELRQTVLAAVVKAKERKGKVRKVKVNRGLLAPERKAVEKGHASNG